MNALGPKPVAISPTMRTKRALVIDDDKSVRAALGQVMEWLLGYVVTLAGDGEEAVSILAGEGGTFDVVISDVLMPGMGGAALARLMAERWPATPVILMSGDSVPSADHLRFTEERPSGRGRERIGRLSKPFSYRQLAQVLQDVSEPPS